MSERIEFAPLGVLEVERTLHAGALFDVVRVRQEERSWCLKLAQDASSTTTSAPPLYSNRFFGVGTSIYAGVRKTGLEAVPAQASGWLDQLLILEAERIRRSAGAWNHAVSALGICDAPYDPSAIGERWEDPGPQRRVGLLMPEVPGATLASLEREEQRALLPRMLPALWDALAHSPHGDLSPDNVILSPQRERFALIDPGVCLTRERHGSLYSSTEWVGTCTPAAYPLFAPGYAGELGQRDLASELRHSLLHAPPSTCSNAARSGQPDVADLHALGVAYYAMLTGEHPLPEHRQHPVWEAAYGEGQGARSEGSHAARIEAQLARGIVPPREHDGALSAAEQELALALLELRTPNRASLLRLASAVLRG